MFLLLDQRPQCRATGVWIKLEHVTMLTMTFISHIDTEKHFYFIVLLLDQRPQCYATGVWIRLEHVTMLTITFI